MQTHMNVMNDLTRSVYLKQAFIIEWNGFAFSNVLPYSVPSNKRSLTFNTASPLPKSKWSICTNYKRPSLVCSIMVRWGVWQIPNLHHTVIPIAGILPIEKLSRIIMFQFYEYNPFVWRETKTWTNFNFYLCIMYSTDLQFHEWNMVLVDLRFWHSSPYATAA